MKTPDLLFKNLIAIIVVAISFSFTGAGNNNHVIDHSKLAAKYYQEDAQWYLDNIPLFECSDKQIEEVYYYRWKLYKAHIRNIGMADNICGGNTYIITEFINMGGREPYGSITAASGLHIYEGRWLKNDRYLDGYIDYMYGGGGNNRWYSENIADATYARYLVNADSSFIINQLSAMQYIYNLSFDYYKEFGFGHFDQKKGLYAIRPCNDATEASIASLEATNNKDVFGGNAFRPTNNSYMYANALAISRIAAMKGDAYASRIYLKRAEDIKANLRQGLWNDSLGLFIDRHFIDNEFVHYWDFIKDRELAGYIPWYFDMPDNTSKYNSAWSHLMDTTKFLGKFGLRTVEPSSKYYMFKHDNIGCEWNGPSWPYYNSQVLGGMANLLNNYSQNIIKPSDYLKVLRLFTTQHYFTKGTLSGTGTREGQLNIVEDYDPDSGNAIMDSEHSSHYNHSCYNDLIITGLCGIRPSVGNTLVINPLVDNSIQYFSLSDVLYHGHKLTVVYDADGSKYKLGKGLTVFVDGKKASLKRDQGKYLVAIGKPVVINKPKPTIDLALNILGSGCPTPSASVNAVPDSLYQAIDGRIWYFSESSIKNRWSTVGSKKTKIGMLLISEKNRKSPV